MKTFLCLLLSASVALGATTEYYLDSGRTSNGDGSEANPWKLWSNIGWSSISNSIGSGDVNLYISSRSYESRAGTFTVTGTGSNGNWLRIIGDTKYNETASGTAVWSTETTGRRAHFTQTSGSGFDIPKNRQYVQLGGIIISNSVFGGVNLGASDNPTTNLHNITITNMIIWSPQNNHGLWFGYGETDCHSIKVSHCIISNTPSESIYMGHYNFMTETITNCIVEYNTVVDSGLVGEGDIDIKPGVKGAIVRYNSLYRQNNLTSGAVVGVAVYATDAQIYGNTFHHTDKNASSAWGVGIYVNADGDGAGTGQAITNCLIYNNLIYASASVGLRFAATTTTSGANMSDIRIWNNTIYGSAGEGLLASRSSSKTVTISEMYNNIFASNTVQEVSLGAGCTVTAANYNLYRGTNSNNFIHNGTTMNFATWQGLGFDANGLTSDPLFTDAGAGTFTLTSSSPARNAGTTLTAFSVDHDGNTRPQGAAWDIGAFEFTAEGAPSVANTPIGGRLRGFRALRQ